jgi:hypothetical protein
MISEEAGGGIRVQRLRHGGNPKVLLGSTQQAMA